MTALAFALKSNLGKPRPYSTKLLTQDSLSPNIPNKMHVLTADSWDFSDLGEFCPNELGLYYDCT